MKHIIPFCIMSLFASACGRYYVVDDVHYRRNGAHQVQLGTVVEKVDRDLSPQKLWKGTGIGYLGTTNWARDMEVHVATERDRSVRNDLEIEAAAKRIDFLKDLKAKAKGQDEIKQATANLEKAMEVGARLKAEAQNNSHSRDVVILLPDSFKIREVLNSEACKSLREDLASSKKNRVVTGIVLTYDNEETKKIRFDGSATYVQSETATQGDATLIFANQSKLRISDGTPIAYQYSRLLWGKGPDGEKQILRIVPDQPGHDKFVPPGMKYDPADLDK